MKKVYFIPQTQSFELIAESKICSMSNPVGLQTGNGSDGGEGRVIIRRR